MMLIQSEEKKIPILMYHSVSDSSTLLFKPFVVTPAQFAEQIAYLHENNYTPITVTQLMRARLHNELVLPERPVVITFDDGFADYFTGALPVLNQYNFTATLYISTAFIEGTSRWLRNIEEGERPMLTWAQVAEINANGIECGAHTHTHPQLDTLPPSKARVEIASSKKILEDHLGQEVLSFAYPFGYFTARVRQIVQEEGFQSACAVRYKMSPENDNPFSLARLMVEEGMSIDAFASLLAGSNTEPETVMGALYNYARTVPLYLARCLSSSVKRQFHTSWQEEIA
jgi:peptidoglycan/xylan/chitin deacetylase (PgdA/CDA1 family)